MLSAFQAQPVIELKQSQKFKVECLLAYGDRLLVGLSNGHLRVYRFNETSTSNGGQASSRPGSGDEAIKDKAKSKSRAVELLREEEDFSRKSVQQLAVIKEAGILISLSDNYVSFYDLQTFELSERLMSTKGATTFAVMSHVIKDDATGIPSIVSKLVVAVKRKLAMWSWQDSEIITADEDITLAASIKSLTWSTGSKVIAGLDPGYVLVDLDSKYSSDIHKTAPVGESGTNVNTRFGAVGSSGMNYVGMGSWIPKPMAAKLAGGELVLARDVNTLFIDENGKPLERRQIPWTTAPEAVGYSYPFLLSLQTSGKGTLEIRNPYTLTLLQSITLPHATILHVPQPNISLAHAGKGFLVASDRCIWQMEALGYDSQIKDLTSRGRYDEAIALIDMLEDTLLYEKKDLRLRDVRMLKAQSLFSAQSYRDALELFSTALAPPAKVIELYPRVIAGDITSIDDNVSEAGSDTESAKSGDPGSPRSKVQAMPVRTKIEADTNDAASISSDQIGKTHQKSHVKKESTTKLEGKDLTFAVNELCAYLAQARVQLQRYISFEHKLKASNLLHEYREGTSAETRSMRYLLSDSIDGIGSDDDLRQSLLDVATLVDTTLFRAYMLTRPRLATSLFRLDNFCAPEVVEEKLYQTGRYKDLIDFLQGKKLHREALELLQKFGKGNAEDEVENEMRGPARTVAYLQQLPFEMIDLILQYVKWPLEEAPQEGMKVFLVDTENAESLPREEVLDFLSTFDPSLSTQYLEHVVNELGDETEDFHERLIDAYLSQLRSYESGKNEVKVEDPVQKKLEQFLRSSSHFNATRMLKKLSEQDARLFESRAILHSKLSQHSKALIIYVFKLQDQAKAEEYCNYTYASATSDNPAGNIVDPDDPSSPNGVYVTLLSLYLEPPSPYEKNFEAALALLSRHGSRLPAYNALNLLPGGLPIKELEAYFIDRMRTATSLAREQAVIQAMSGVEKTRVEAKLRLGAADMDMEADNTTPVAGLNRRIVIAEAKLCNVCHKRLGRSAIRVWPDGEVVHYGCTERRRLRRSGSGGVMIRG
ncbi:MAG: Vacuolar morphogenesis protein 6 [Chrysothrix sp. TS-e1954]|nr:MAG: Vacuolar morphogenesis protein 6 [Chrysothrix sp. TS-e1954]